MPIQTCCDDCKKPYQLDDRFAGRSVKCKACGNVFTAAVTVRARPATPAKRPVATRPPPPAEESPSDLPSLAGLAELEATGTPNQFSALPPPTVVVARDPWYLRAAAPRPTTIHDADPAVARQRKKRDEMSRRAFVFGGSGIGLFGFGGVGWWLLRGVRAYNRYEESEQRQADIRDSMAQRQAESDARTQAVADRYRAADAEREARYAQQKADREAAYEAARQQREADHQAFLDAQARQEAEFKQKVEADRQAREAAMAEQRERMRQASEAQMEAARQRAEASRQRAEEINRQARERMNGRR